jgi:hypothetical protein
MSGPDLQFPFISVTVQKNKKSERGDTLSNSQVKEMLSTIAGEKSEETNSAESKEF